MAPLEQIFRVYCFTELKMANFSPLDSLAVINCLLHLFVTILNVARLQLIEQCRSYREARFRGWYFPNFAIQNHFTEIAVCINWHFLSVFQGNLEVSKSKFSPLVPNQGQSSRCHSSSAPNMKIFPGTLWNNVCLQKELHDYIL